MRKPSQIETLTKLLEAYKEEARLYKEMQEAAAEQFDLLRGGSAPRCVADLTERRCALAELIDEIESAIRPLRGDREELPPIDSAHCLKLAHELDQLLDQIAGQVRDLIEIERKNSIALINATATEAVQ